MIVSYFVTKVSQLRINHWGLRSENRPRMVKRTVRPNLMKTTVTKTIVTRQDQPITGEDGERLEPVLYV